MLAAFSHFASFQSTFVLVECGAFKIQIGGVTTLKKRSDDENPAGGALYNAYFTSLSADMFGLGRPGDTGCRSVDNTNLPI